MTRLNMSGSVLPTESVCTNSNFMIVLYLSNDYICIIIAFGIFHGLNLLISNKFCSTPNMTENE